MPEKPDHRPDSQREHASHTTEDNGQNQTRIHQHIREVDFVDTAREVDDCRTARRLFSATTTKRTCTPAARPYPDTG